MLVQSKGRFLRVPPTKARRVGRILRGKHVREALSLLRLMPTKPARLLYKLLKVAVGNAQENYDLRSDALYIENVLVDQGPTLKRFRPRARMRADRIRKRTSHITVILTDREED